MKPNGCGVLEASSMNDRAAPLFKNVSAGRPTAIKLGVAVLIRNERGLILLERRSDCGLWGLPGGRIEPGESIRDAVVREVEEETGLSVEVARLLGVYSDPRSGRIIHYPEAVVHSIDIFVEARITGGVLCISAESEELEFFNLGCLPSDLVPSSVPLLKDVLPGSTGQIR